MTIKVTGYLLSTRKVINMFIKLENGTVINTDRLDAFYFNKDRNMTEFYMSGRNYAFLAKGNVVDDVLAKIKAESEEV